MSVSLQPPPLKGTPLEYSYLLKIARLIPCVVMALGALFGGGQLGQGELCFIEAGSGSAAVDYRRLHT